MDFRTRLRRIGDALGLVGLLVLFVGPVVGVVHDAYEGRESRAVGASLALAVTLICAGKLLFTLGRPRPPLRHPYRG